MRGSAGQATPGNADALKGRNATAQGNALGWEAPHRAVALNGRNRTSRATAPWRPHRATGVFPSRGPRALPWAVVSEPFGLVAASAFPTISLRWAKAPGMIGGDR